MGQPLSEGSAREVLSVFLRLGLTAFGGPAAHTGLLRDAVVRRRAWIDDTEFLELVAATNVIPGPNSTELALSLGRRRAGWRGFAAAGIGFILPACLLTLVLAWLAVGAATSQAASTLLEAIDPIIVAILAWSVIGLGRSLGRRPLRLVVAAVAAVAYLGGVAELAILALGAAAIAAAHAAGVAGSPRPRPDAGTGDGGLAWVGPAAATGALAAAASVAPVALGPLFLVFLKVGALLFGSGYVLVAFLRSDLVDGLGWLTEGQLLDAVAAGQLTPGPLTSTATYIGYLLAGLPGAIVATIGIFSPAFVFVALLDPIVRAIRTRPLARATLDGAAAAALGLMAGVTVSLGITALLPGGSVDGVAVGIVVAALLLLGSGRVGPTLLVLAGVTLGALRIVLGS